MKTRLLISAGLSIFLPLTISLEACSRETDPMMSELAAAPRVAGTNSTDVTPIVRKYIAPGTNLEQAFGYLAERGFKKYDFTGREVPVGQRWFILEREDRYKVMFSEKTRVIVESDGGLIIRVRATRFLVGM